LTTIFNNYSSTPYDITSKHNTNSVFVKSQNHFSDISLKFK
jgi:hypothetical protein